jgi:CheY-like chemotaxis protein
MILDRDPQAADALAQLLQLYYDFVETSIAYTGLSAVHLTCNSKFDMVIIDLHLDENDGVEVAKAIRSRSGINLPKLIALSTDRARVAAERSASLFDFALNKLLVVKELFQAIESG